MTSRIAARRIASPPQLGDSRRAPTAAHDVNDAPSLTGVVAKVVVGAFLVLIGLTVVALAPMAIAVLLGLAGVSGLLALVGRQRYAGRPARRATAGQSSRAAVGPGTILLSSAALLVAALVVPDRYGIVFATLGVMGLAILRLGKSARRLEHGGSALPSEPPVAPVSSRGGVARVVGEPRPADCPRAQGDRYELGQARFSASDRPTPREWRRAHRVRAQPFEHHERRHLASR
jgi:hypothetical protein